MMIQGAASEANLSMALMPSIVFTTCTTAKTINQRNQLSMPKSDNVK